MEHCPLLEEQDEELEHSQLGQELELEHSPLLGQNPMEHCPLEQDKELERSPLEQEPLGLVQEQGHSPMVGLGCSPALGLGRTDYQ